MNYRNTLELGQVVKALAGRDKEKIFLVVGIIDDNNVYLADGAGRKIESPKRKKIKHLQKYNLISKSVNEKLVKGDVVENSEIKKELSALK